MKHLPAIAILLASLRAFAWQDATPPQPTAETYSAALGDINHDKLQDSVYITHPKWISEEEFYGDCNNEACSVTVAFSFGAPPIHHTDAVECLAKSIGDIDSDGIDEIVVATGWFIGLRGPRYFYTLKNNKWKLVGETYHFNYLGDDEEFDPKVKKIARGKFKTETLVFSEDGGDEITVTKTFTVE